ncbi:hypothetical protein PHLCEN_2v12444 [Hermanssonia centrifuga]|uniref:Uncharacterized protein n=1 Tax=Hermanssonia centrifuga TaxID=98765 RepID=A0A2R6NHB4_9APHY|nr:hypothetical protein PHLCEN_2v12444 [Hermanssonia centrifuga]
MAGLRPGPSVSLSGAILRPPSLSPSGSGGFVVHQQNRTSEDSTAAAPSPPPQAIIPSQSRPTRPLPTVTEAVIPDLPKNRKGEPSIAWKTAVKHWIEGDSSIGLSCALKSWPSQWFSREMSRVTGAKYKQRELIGREYERLGSDDGIFILEYPEAAVGIKALLAAINKRREERGELKPRRSKNGPPGEW